MLNEREKPKERKRDVPGGQEKRANELEMR